MFSFIISLVALVLGYFTYGKFVARVFSPDPSRTTPAFTKQDGVDFIAMPTWKVFMIQLLNIAGTGPIFGAIMGAEFGPSSYIWIVFGCIFAGAVQDYLTGMLSVRHGGASLPELIGIHVGKATKNLILVFTVILLMLVGVVFVYSPAIILGEIAGLFGTPARSRMAWVFIIFIYYVIATLLPIDKVIGKIYPIFALGMLFMAAALMVCLFVKWPSIPEFWHSLGNGGPEVGITGQSIFPCLFITVACGAISGFHATQSPMMARCIKNEANGRPVFYGAMITEGIIALIWAAVSSWFFFDGGMAEIGATSDQAPAIVTSVAKAWLGVFGGILAILGVVAAPITSGDTAFRSARLIIADFFKVDQSKKARRLLICLPVFLASALILWFNISNEDGFNIVWRYFGWANQTLSCFTLWMLTSFLTRKRKGLRYLITLIPSCFMTAVCVTYICIDKIGFGLPDAAAPYIAVSTGIICLILFYLWRAFKADQSGVE